MIHNFGPISLAGLRNRHLHRSLATKAAVSLKSPPATPPSAIHDEIKPETQFRNEQPSKATGFPINQNIESAQPRASYELNFDDTSRAYMSKTLRDLMRNYFVLGLCTSSILVKNNEKVMKLTRNLLGKRVFGKLMRATFYGQFVAGQDEQEIEPVIRHLSSFGVKTILDYSAEEDVNDEEVQEEELPNRSERDDSHYLAQMEGGSSPLRRYQQSADFADRRKYLPVARTYFYHGESQCEKNLEIFLRAIEAVANATGNTGFAAIKLTALARPKLLMKLSKIIDYMHRVDAGSNPQDGKKETLMELLARFEKLHDTEISSLDEDDREMLANLFRRVERIGAYASQMGGVRCMIDAEQTYMQPAINMIAMEMMQKFNKKEAIIFNTYQCYLKSAYSNLREDLAMARREGLYFGAKLVRGAYMDQERARALKLGYEDPINPTFEATTEMYQKTLAYLMDEIEREFKESLLIQNQQVVVGPKRIGIMVASHNEGTVRFALEQMRTHKIEPEHKVICFGQLYGMCDHVSFTLGQSGYSVYKYTPYGPIEEVLPYLGRRAIENHGFLSKLQRERSLLSKEILKRLVTGRWFYKPNGNFKPI